MCTSRGDYIVPCQDLGGRGHKRKKEATSEILTHFDFPPFSCSFFFLVLGDVCGKKAVYLARGGIKGLRGKINTGFPKKEEGSGT